MNNLIPLSESFPFNHEAIFYQLNRIFLYPDFQKSTILKRFLYFIVRETLIGNANQLKEYTIAVKALDKPVNFNPQHDCIVRTHAKRLRHALSHYYKDECIDDQIIISIPKGKYVPVFMDRQQWVDRVNLNDMHAQTGVVIHNNEPVTFTILPFVCSRDDKMLVSFSDSLCLLLCSHLSQVSRINVLAYQAVKSLVERYLDLKEFGSLVGFNHIITGGIYYVKGKIRITIQIVECRTYRQIWSEIFECKASSNLLDMQDQICRRVIGEVRNLASPDPAAL